MFSARFLGTYPVKWYNGVHKFVAYNNRPYEENEYDFSYRALL